MVNESIAAISFVLDLPYEDRAQCLSSMPVSVMDNMEEALSLADEQSGEIPPQKTLEFAEKLQGLRDFLGDRLGGFGAVPTIFATKGNSQTDSESPSKGVISLPVNALIDTKKLIDVCRKHSDSQRKSGS